MVAPSPNFLTTNSTVILVPFIQGLPTITAGSSAIYSLYAINCLFFQMYAFYNSPSHLLTTLVASALPSTLVAVRNISQKWSIGNIKAIPSAGILNMVQVAVTTTSEARGTPAIPLLVSISTSSMVSCVPVSSGIL